MSKENAKQQIKGLVKEFLNFPEEELNKKPEEQIKFLFIEPLFEALGWKVFLRIVDFSSSMNYGIVQKIFGFLIRTDPRLLSC